MTDTIETARQSLIREFLNSVNARKGATYRDGDWQINHYTANGKFFYLLRMGSEGFDMLIPATSENNVDATFAAVRAYLGVTP